MADTPIDKLKKLGAAFLDRMALVVGVVDDDPPTYEDGDVKPIRVHKTDRGVYVHVANTADSPDGLASQTTLAAILARLSPTTVGPTNVDPKVVPEGTAEPIVGSSTPATRQVCVTSDFDNDPELTIYMGNVDVTVANGHPLGPGDVYTREIDNADKLYCISNGADQLLRIEVL